MPAMLEQRFVAGSEVHGHAVLARMLGNRLADSKKSDVRFENLSRFLNRLSRKCLRVSICLFIFTLVLERHVA
jgi:hypothetical protein